VSVLSFLGNQQESDMARSAARRGRPGLLHRLFGI
jgi:hypothetical protein